jgi:hypothetical protein
MSQATTILIWLLVVCWLAGVICSLAVVWMILRPDKPRLMQPDRQPEAELPGMTHQNGMDKKLRQAFWEELPTARGR